MPQATGRGPRTTAPQRPSHISGRTVSVALRCSDDKITRPRAITPSRGSYALPPQPPRRRSRINAAFPFDGRRWRHRDVYKAFASRLGSAHPRTIAVSTEPFPTSVYPDRTSIFATTTKIGTRGRSTRAHAHASTPDPHAPLHLPGDPPERDEYRSHA